MSSLLCRTSVLSTSSRFVLFSSFLPRSSTLSTSLGYKTIQLAISYFHLHHLHHPKHNRKNQLSLHNSLQNIRLHSLITKNGLATSSGSSNNHQQQPQTPEFIAERMVQCLPSQLIPYAVLMRLTKPTGTWLLLWPCWWSIALSTTAGSFPPLSLLALFGTGAVLLRSSGCIINDLWDRKIDASVERTKSRPIAAKQISPLDAMVLVHGLNACGLLVILQFDLNSILLAFSSMALVLTYPACKRFTNYPQVVLGMAFNWGALLGWSAACNGSLDLAAVLPLYLGGICWTLIYDTIYAHQDKKDDVKLGLKSTAIKFGNRTSEYLYGFTALMTSSLALAGLNTGQCWPYYLSVAACGVNLARIISRTDMNNAEQCARAFNQNIHIGWMLFAGIVLSTLWKENPVTIEDGTNKADCQDLESNALLNTTPLKSTTTQQPLNHLPSTNLANL